MLDMVARQDAIARKFIAELEAENARLKAKIERLTEAGDDMAFHIGNDEESQYKCADAWRAAKESKQS
jgi:hypothetical protein